MEEGLGYFLEVQNDSTDLLSTVHGQAPWGWCGDLRLYQHNVFIHHAVWRSNLWKVWWRIWMPCCSDSVLFSCHPVLWYSWFGKFSANAIFIQNSHGFHAYSSRLAVWPHICCLFWGYSGEKTGGGGVMVANDWEFQVGLSLSLTGVKT